MKKYSFKNYSEYLKDNPKGYWFKRKLYGWGWIPAKWQGWAVVLGFVGILLLNGFYFSLNISEDLEPSIEDLILFFGVIFISVISLIWIGFKKGEKPKWTWGK